MSLFYQFQSRLLLQGTLHATTALRIGAGRSLEPIGTDLPVIRDAAGRPFIPGSSFKGVLRSRTESLLRALLPGRRGGACDPIHDQERCITPQEIRREKDRSQSDEQLTDWIINNSCVACQLYGSPWLASRVQVRDWLVDETFWLGQFQVRDGVAIDRDTETSAENLLYSYEVVPAGTAFEGTIVVENAEPWQLGLLFAGLEEFDSGSLPIGGASSRGLGSVALQWNLAGASRYISHDHLWAYLEDPKTAGASPEGLLQEWKQAMLTELGGRRKAMEVHNA